MFLLNYRVSADKTCGADSLQKQDKHIKPKTTLEEIIENSAPVVYVAKAEQELDEPINDLAFRKAPPSSSHLSYLTVQILILRAQRGGSDASLID